MKTGYIVLAVAVIAAAAAIGAFAYIENTGPVVLDEVIDDDGKIDEFCLVTDDEITEKIRADIEVPRHITISYVGDVTGWFDDIEINEENKLVVFKTEVKSHRIDYVFRFDNVGAKSLEGYLVNGIPTLEATASGDFSIELMYIDHKGLDDVQLYNFETFEFIVGENVSLPVYYGDSFFSIPATEYNPDMMAFALGLEMSSGVDKKNRSESVIKLLKDIGCSNAKANASYNREPTIESTDVAIGSKEWNGYNIIFVVLNGTKYTNEFAANVLLGESGNHYGFTLACNEALNMLRQFISDNNITGKTKILLTGYSRTAAGANLAAAYLSDTIAEGKVTERIGNIELTKEDVYGFSFETPLCGYYENGMIRPDDSRYDNIWYVINPDDPVTYVPTKNYGFVRYGHQYTIDSHNSSKQSTMLTLSEKYYGEAGPKYLDMTKFEVISDVKYPSEIFDGFFDKFFSSLGTREYYHENIEKDISETVYAVFYKQKLLTDIVDKSGGIMTFLADMYTYSGDKQAFIDHFKPAIAEATKVNGISQYTDSIVNSLYQISELVKRYFNEGVMSVITDKYVLSLVANTNVILISHLPSMVYCYIIQESLYYQ